MKDTFLFDLDGTLLPMDQNYFVKSYLSEITSHFANFGLEPSTLKKSIWAGFECAVKNNGTRTNEEAFWECFGELLGNDIFKLKPEFDNFYETKFKEISYSVNPSSNAKKAIDILKHKNYKLVLATNPIFPKAATFHRINWAGLSPSDFNHITYYENSTFTKPNPKYYEEIMKKVSSKPENSMMVGNDVIEDMAAAKTGMDTYLITDCLINKNDEELSFENKGSFDDFIEFANSLPSVSDVNSDGMN